MRKITVFILAMFFVGCHHLQKVQQVAQEIILENGGSSTIVTPGDIGNGLRQALNSGIKNQVSKLTAENGFYGNSLVRIGLPKKLQVVDSTLRKLGMGALADQGLKAINKTAQEAVKTATPIFVNAVKRITFEDAKNILMGADNSATTYLQEKTTEKLYKKFSPVIRKSFQSVGADEIWREVISKYNSIPLIKKVNPDMVDYVTNEALNGVFKMIAVEEKGIRKSTAMRTTNLLKRVFALQDRK